MTSRWSLQEPQRLGAPYCCLGMQTAGLGRLDRVYLALAEAHLGARRPRSGLSAYAFRESSSATLSDMVI